MSAHPIAPFLARHAAVGKNRREVGDPVAELKQHIRFEKLPPRHSSNLVLPLNAIDPVAGDRAQQAGKLVFHCVGDTGGIHGTASQEAIAAAMEDQIKHPDHEENPALFTTGETWFISTG
jgi:hypothetical protein